MVSAKSLSIEDRQDNLGKEIVALEELAGISEDIERCNLGPIPDIDDAPFGSEEDKRNTELYWERQRGFFRRCMRKALFSVGDIDMRKRLVAKYREAQELRIARFRQEVYDANDTLESARSVGINWWLSATIFGVFSVALGVCSRRRPPFEPALSVGHCDYPWC